MRQPVVVLGVPVDRLDMAGTLDRIEELVRIGRATGQGHQMVTINADFAVRALFDPELRYLLQKADLATADGMPLVWGARRLGFPLRERVAGADLVPALAQRVSEKGLSIYFLGAAPGVAARAAGLLKERNPGLRIAGVCSPPFSPVLTMDPSILEDIHAADPDILLVAFGNPKQEKWIGMYGQELGVPVMIGVGGSLDFIAGATRRAPRWMQRIGFEWLFRLAQEPRRLWQRYVLDFVVFAVFFLQQWWILRPVRSAGAQPLLVELTFHGCIAVLSACGRVTVDNLEPLFTCGEQALKRATHLLVDLGRAEFLDSAGYGALLELNRQARRAGSELSLAAVPPAIYSALKLLKLEKTFPIYATVEACLTGERSRKADENGYNPKPAHLLHSGIGGQHWLVLQGPRIFDATTASAVKAAGMNYLANNPFLVLDLADTVFLASAGLAVLASLRQRAQALGGDLRVVNCSREVLQVIKIVRFDRVLALYNDLPQAIA